MKKDMNQEKEQRGDMNQEKRRNMKKDMNRRREREKDMDQEQDRGLIRAAEGEGAWRRSDYKEEALKLYEEPLEKVCHAADEIRRFFLQRQIRSLYDRKRQERKVLGGL